MLCSRIALKPNLLSSPLLLHSKLLAQTQLSNTTVFKRNYSKIKGNQPQYWKRTIILANGATVSLLTSLGGTSEIAKVWKSSVDFTNVPPIGALKIRDKGFDQPQKMIYYYEEPAQKADKK
eukprot:TRINITY_DN1431_c0_g1_i1.p1 TRINITY_DN1431_c0_g1~~TRINITY_DN1431_c0_g1_i1.p1  ORF type:complete len:121 (-),score=23.92 TRINITY_DN1431_c0_g1_i1:44-406(-)